MRAVHLDAVDAEPRGTLGRRDEIVTNLAHAGLVQRHGRHFVRAMRHRRRRHGLPAARRGPGRICAPPSQGAWLDALRPACASCTLTAMGEYLRTASSTRPSAASLASLVQAEVVRRDAALGRHRRGLDDQQLGAGQRHVAQVNLVPVGSRALVGRVLAHRRHRDAVGKFEIANLVGRESWDTEQVPSETSRRRRASRCVPIVVASGKPCSRRPPTPHASPSPLSHLAPAAPDPPPAQS